MIRYTKRDKGILLALKRVLRNNEAPDKKTIIKTARIFFKQIKGWSKGFSRLVDKGLLKEHKALFSFTHKGKILAAKFRKDYYRQEFDQALLRYLHSKTYSKFCKLVYGMNLCQFSMVNMRQLHRLISLLKLSENDKILDLGCGIGKITEYISDTTGARITGIDFAEKVIEEAQKRTENKRNRLVYKVGDIDSLKFIRNRFSGIICIDTLYFVENLNKTVRKMKAIVKPGGQMGIFYSQSAKPGESKKILQPRATELAQVLNAQHLKFRAYDYTLDEYAHWRKSKKTANLLKSEFRREGNLKLYNSRLKESEYVLKFVKAGRLRRFLYHVRV